MEFTKSPFEQWFGDCERNANANIIIAQVNIKIKQTRVLEMMSLNSRIIIFKNYELDN